MIISLGLAIGSVRSLSPYEPEALSLFGRMSSPPTTDRAALINTLIKSLKTAGVWAKLDALYLLAAADAQAARQNWVSDQYNLSTVNSPTFTADRGYAGNGSSSYLSTSFNPSTATSPKFGLNSGHAAAWCLTSRAAAGTSLLGSRNSAITAWIDVQPRVSVSGDKFVHRINSGGGISIANSDSTGLFSANRSGATASQAYRNGSALGTDATSSVLVPNATVIILARGVQGGSVDAFSSDQVAMASVGASLTGAEHGAFYAAINTYLTEIGAV